MSSILAFATWILMIFSVFLIFQVSAMEVVSSSAYIEYYGIWRRSLWFGMLSPLIPYLLRYRESVEVALTRMSMQYRYYGIAWMIVSAFLFIKALYYAKSLSLKHMAVIKLMHLVPKTLVAMLIALVLSKLLFFR